MLTAAPVTYTLPEFFSVPARCGISYTYSLDRIGGGVAVDFNSDPTVRLFTFEHYDSVSIAGTYTVFIDTVPGASILAKQTVSFTLILENPCLYPDLI